VGGFYERVFNFREIRYFDIEGKVTGLFSKAMTSPDGKIRIPLNESQDDRARSRNSCATTRARASSTSRSARTISTRRSRPCAQAA
jgi:4-hydroxyphenylpyruvate dioxygenase-like putative hemolysin